MSCTDPDLTDRGRTQAARLAAAARRWPRPTELVVSPMKRALATAAAVAEALDIAPTVLPWFEEIGLPPHCDGAPGDRVNEFLSQARHRAPLEWWDGLPGGETFGHFHDRVIGNLTQFLAARGGIRPDPVAHPSLWRVAPGEHRIVFVGHGGSNATAIGFLLGIEAVPWPWERFVTGHASISRLRASSLMGGHLFGLRTLSDVEHLDHDLRTR